VVDATHFYRTYNWEYVSDPTLLAFLRRAVVFAMDSGYHDWVFDPSEMTNKKAGEYQIYDVDRTTTVTTVAPSFDQWLLRIGEDHRFEREGEEEPSEPEFQPVYKPDSPCADPIDYVLDGLLKWKKPPSKRDAKRWLAWNANTIRDLARSIRDDGNTDVFPILADALEEAGCTNADLLGSCRTGDPDIDGVWVLQVLLGKA
jgi:hypothetical protein